MAAEVAVALVVGDDNNDVGVLLVCFGHGAHFDSCEGGSRGA